MLRCTLNDPVIVGNIPFHLTTPILRRLLAEGAWCHAVLLTQWEVARKRAGVGGTTMLTAQSWPWFTFALHGRVPSRHFTPRPSVDGGILGISRRGSPLVSPAERADYERFVHAVFTGRGNTLARLVANASGCPVREASRILAAMDISNRHRARDLSAVHWVTLWTRTTGGDAHRQGVART